MGTFYPKGKEILERYAFAIKYLTNISSQHTDHEEENIKLYLKAEQIVVGVPYLKGQKLTQHYSKAVQWVLKAADQNALEAYMLMGGLYHDGLGVERDHKMAMECFRNAKTQNTDAKSLIQEPEIEQTPPPRSELSPAEETKKPSTKYRSPSGHVNDESLKNDNEKMYEIFWDYKSKAYGGDVDALYNLGIM